MRPHAQPSCALFAAHAGDGVKIDENEAAAQAQDIARLSAGVTCHSRQYTWVQHWKTSPSRHHALCCRRGNIPGMWRCCALLT